MKISRLYQTVPLTLIFLCVCAHAAVVPLDLPKPDGKPGDLTKPVKVYRKDLGGQRVLQSVQLEKGKRYKIEITYLKSGSAAFWLEQVELTGKGDLTNVTQTEKEFTYLLDNKREWSVRQDVTFAEARVDAAGRSCALTATANGKHMGPELGFGYVLGAFHDEQVLLIKTAMGNRSLFFDYRPPSSGPIDADMPDKSEGMEYRLMVEGESSKAGIDAAFEKNVKPTNAQIAFEQMISQLDADLGSTSWSYVLNMVLDRPSNVNKVLESIALDNPRAITFDNQSMPYRTKPDDIHGYDHARVGKDNVAAFIEAFGE